MTDVRRSSRQQPTKEKECRDPVAKPDLDAGRRALSRYPTAQSLTLARIDSHREERVSCAVRSSPHAATAGAVNDPLDVLDLGPHGLSLTAVVNLCPTSAVRRSRLRVREPGRGLGRARLLSMWRGIVLTDE